MEVAARGGISVTWVARPDSGPVREKAAAFSPRRRGRRRSTGGPSPSTTLIYLSRVRSGYLNYYPWTWMDDGWEGDVAVIDRAHRPLATPIDGAIDPPLRSGSCLRVRARDHTGAQGPGRPWILAAANTGSRSIGYMSNAAYSGTAPSCSVPRKACTVQTQTDATIPIRSIAPDGLEEEKTPAGPGWGDNR